MSKKAGLYIIAFLAFAAFLAQICRHISQNVLDSFHTVDKALIVANEFENGSNDSLYYSIEKYKVTEPSFYAASIHLKQISKDHIAYITSLRNELIMRAGGLDSVSGDVIKRDDIDIPTHLMVDEGNGDTLFERRKELKEAFLKICANDSIRKGIENSFKVSRFQTGSKQWSKNTFEHVPVVAALTILSKFKNDCISGERELLISMSKKVTLGK